MADPEAPQDGACGFTQQAWALFLAPLPAALIGQDPKSHRPYVRHQVAVEMLNLRMRRIRAEPVRLHKPLR